MESLCLLMRYFHWLTALYYIRLILRYPSYIRNIRLWTLHNTIVGDNIMLLYSKITSKFSLSFKNERIFPNDKVLTCKLQLWPQKRKFLWWNRFKKLLKQLKGNLINIVSIFCFFVFFLPIVWIIFVGSKPPIRFPLGLYPISSSKYKIKIENTFSSLAS